MDINPLPSSTDVAGSAAGSVRNVQAGSSAGAQQTAQTSEPPSAAVSLSAGLLALGNAAQDVNVAKVAQIRAALADGSLTINVERIADGLVNDAIALLK